MVTQGTQHVLQSIQVTVDCALLRSGEKEKKKKKKKNLFNRKSAYGAPEHWESQEVCHIREKNTNQ